MAHGKSPAVSRESRHELGGLFRISSMSQNLQNTYMTQTLDCFIFCSACYVMGFDIPDPCYTRFWALKATLKVLEAGPKNNSDRLTRVVSHQNFKSALFFSGSKIICWVFSYPRALPSGKNRHLFSKLIYFGASQNSTRSLKVWFFSSFWLSTDQKVFARHPISVLYSICPLIGT